MQGQLTVEEENENAPDYRSTLTAQRCAQVQFTQDPIMIGCKPKLDLISLQHDLSRKYVLS
jgi:hypothetical protein